MTFQFQCPDCERLEVDDSQIGQQVICPFCGKKLVVPERSSVRVDRAEESTPVARQLQQELASVAERQPLVQSESNASVPRRRVRRGKMSAEAEFGPALELYHLSCSKGFVMEVPNEMLGQTALCPCCHQKLVLRLKDTHEFKRRRDIR